MNKRIFFDSQTYDYEIFKTKFIDIIFMVGVTYFVNVFIVSKSTPLEFTKVKIIPFTLLKIGGRDKIIKKLYQDISTYISYCDPQSFYDEAGDVYYEKAFYICISERKL